MFSIMAIPTYSPTNNAQGFLFTTFSPAFIFCLFDNSHPRRLWDISLWFWFAFPWLLGWWIPFHVPISHLHVLFGKMSIQSFCSFFNWFVFLLLSSLNILDSNPLSDVFFTNIFSHSIDCLLTHWYFFLAMQKLFSLMQSHLSIFAFVGCTFGMYRFLLFVLKLQIFYFMF